MICQGDLQEAQGKDSQRWGGASTEGFHTRAGAAQLLYRRPGHLTLPATFPPLPRPQRDRLRRAGRDVSFSLPLATGGPASHPRARSSLLSSGGVLGVGSKSIKGRKAIHSSFLIDWEIHLPISEAVRKGNTLSTSSSTCSV